MFLELPQLPPVVWRFSSKILAARHDCTVHGITTQCHAGCCTSTIYWPSRTGDGGICKHLGTVGCVFAPQDRPITCLLYPLRLSKSGSVTLHHVCRFTTSVCKGNYDKGPRLIDALAQSLIGMMGEIEYNLLLASVNRGMDYVWRPPRNVIEAVTREALQEMDNVIPTARSKN